MSAGTIFEGNLFGGLFPNPVADVVTGGAEFFGGGVLTKKQAIGANGSGGGFTGSASLIDFGTKNFQPYAGVAYGGGASPSLLGIGNPSAANPASQNAPALISLGANPTGVQTGGGAGGGISIGTNTLLIAGLVGLGAILLLKK